jgi:hypothetical protein
MLAMLVLLLPCAIRAQLASGDVLGTVVDSTGAVVPGAKVTLLNTGTGIASSMNTNQQGEYVFSSVQIGTLKITVEAKGFKSFSVPDLVLTAGQRIRVDAALQVGSQVETVEVQASATAVQLQSDSSDINAVIDTNTIDDMPTNGRNYYSLIQLQPGVTVAGGGGGSSPFDSRPTMSFSANGQAFQYNNNMIDGMDNNMRALGTVAVEPSLDALQEVQVETSNYSAEYSHTGGGIANLITKSGTNDFHGTAFEFMRNDDFDAYSWVAPGNNKANTWSELRQNQFGGSLGGPIIKKKAFFFGDYQGWRRVSGGTPSTELVPNTDEYNSIHDYANGTTQTITLNDQWQATNAGDPVTHNIVLTKDQITPVGLAYLLQNPKPMCDSQANQMCGGTEGTTNWYGTANSTQNANTYDGRIDYHLNDKNTLFGRFSHNMTNSTSAAAFPAAQIVPGNSAKWSGSTLNPVGDNNVALDWVHVFNSTTLFEAKAAYLRAYEHFYTEGSEENWMTMMGYGCSPTFCNPINGMPGVAFSTTSGTYASASPVARNYNMAGDNIGTSYIDNVFQYNGSLALNRKSHSIKIGLGLIRRQLNYTKSSGYRMGIAANYTGNILSDLLEGDAVTAQGSAAMAGTHARTWEPSIYFQDDWRATKNLTLNLGLRYDIYTPMSDHEGNLSNFDTSTDLIISPNLLGTYSGNGGSFKSNATAGLQADFLDIAPRVGFAYSLNSRNVVLRSMVLRGGFGLSYFPSNSGKSDWTTLTNTPYIWSFGCGVLGYTGSASCGSTGSNYPSALADGGYQMTIAYPEPAPSFDLTLATNPFNYASGFTNDQFIATNYKPSYIEQFNLQLQKQIANNNVLTAGFVGSLGRRIPTLQNINQPISGANLLNNIFPMATSAAPWMTNVLVGEVMSAANSSWEAGEATYERRLTSGLSASVNYTWARSSSQGSGASECVLSGCPMDNGSGTPVTVKGWQEYTYAGSTSHVASGMVTYNMPFGNSLHGVAGTAVKGWTLNGTGSWSTGPWSQVTSAMNQSGLSRVATIGFGNSPGEFPNRVPGVSTKPTNRSLSTWINPQAFALQTAGMLGNAKENDVQGPRVRDTDLSLGKTFSLLEGFKLQFRAEAFNFTNTASLALASSSNGPPSPTGTLILSNYGSDGKGELGSNFGVITNTAATYAPREFQFGLKLIY